MKTMKSKLMALSLLMRERGYIARASQVSKLVFVLPLLVGYQFASANQPAELFGEVVSSSSVDRIVSIDNSTKRLNVTGGGGNKICCSR